MQTGDIILISGTGKQSKAIQKFQQRQDPESGKWNHSGLIYITKHDVYVYEASYIQQRNLKAAVVITPLSAYMESDCNIMILKHNKDVDYAKLESWMFHYVGTPYGYSHLTFVQGIYKLSGLFLGKSNNADRRMICHEYCKTVWNRTNRYFPGIEHIGDVKDLYHCPHFTKELIK